MITRKHFLRTIAGAGAGLFGASLLVGCKSDGSEPPATDAPPSPIDAPKLPPDAAPDAPPAATCGNMISSNHGHAMVLPQADVDAGVEKTYNIQGTSGHPHMVVITAAMFVTLKSTKMLVVESSEDRSHTHTVTISCP